MIPSVHLSQELLDRWHLGDRELLAAIRAGELGDLDVSSLLISYLRTVLESSDLDEAHNHGPRSLTSTAIESIVRFLNSSSDLLHDIQQIMGHLNDNTLRDLLISPSLRYPVLLACLHVANEDLGEGESILDIDDIVLASERWFRARGHSNNGDGYILSLEELCGILSISSDENGIGVFHRPSALKPGIDLLVTQGQNGNHRETTSTELPLSGDTLGLSMSVHLYANSRIFAKRLHGEIDGQLHGLNWENVLLTGEVVTQTLLTRAKRDPRKSVLWNSDNLGSFDLYIYGLNMEETNNKVAEIYNIWAENCSPQGRTRLVVKNANYIRFIDDAHSGPCRIRLKLFRSVREALLALEPCAIGFDGRQVLMLPSYARALETGYLTLSMERLWSYRNYEPREKSFRLYEHCGLGFRLKIPRSYVKALSNDTDSHFLLQQFQEPKTKGGDEGMVVYPLVPARNLADPETLADNIDFANEELFSILRQAIFERLQIPSRGGFSNYLTRRIRQEVYSFDLDSIEEKQITIPMLIPTELEAYINGSLLSGTDVSHQWIIPVHDPSKHDPLAPLPSLPTNGHRNGNPRYWVISNESMWAGQQHVLDELSRILWFLHSWFAFASRHDLSDSTASPECLFWMAQLLRKRLGPHLFVSTAGDCVLQKRGLPPAKESLLFRTLTSPNFPPEYYAEILDPAIDESFGDSEEEDV